MKIAFILDSPIAFQSGIWWHRIEQPMRALSKRGHGVAQFVIKKEMTKAEIEYPDVVVFGRTYPVAFDPIKIMKDYKAAGKRVVYDMDDDFWQVAKDNPSSLASNANKDQYEGMIKEADEVITPSPVLANKFKKLDKKKRVSICPNGIDFEEYKLRDGGNEELVIGYMGASSHWKDLCLITGALEKLAKKYEFRFDVYGLCSEPLESLIYFHQKYLAGQFQPEHNEYFKSSLDFFDGLKRLRGRHYPFMPPELHPTVLHRVNFDIGIAPLEDNEFNRGKSNIKFYEYASVGTVCLASDVEPYKQEVGYRCKNTEKGWYDALEKLIVNKKFRKELQQKQYDWVKKNRSLEAIGIDWEVGLQKKGGLKILNQEK